MKTMNIPDTALMLKLIEAIEDEKFGLENAKIIALSLCSQLNMEQSTEVTNYLSEMSVIGLYEDVTQPEIERAPQLPLTATPNSTHQLQQH